jgi:hypothetical protein
VLEKDPAALSLVLKVWDVAAAAERPCGDYDHSAGPLVSWKPHADTWKPHINAYITVLSGGIRAFGLDGQTITSWSLEVRARLLAPSAHLAPARTPRTNRCPLCTLEITPPHTYTRATGRRRRQRRRGARHRHAARGRARAPLARPPALLTLRAHRGGGPNGAGGTAQRPPATTMRT